MAEEERENLNQPEEGRVPYFEKEIACPMCGVETLHRQLKEGTYIVEERQEDQFVSKYRWIKPEYNKFHFYYFRFWHCVECGFTDEYVVFYNPAAKGRSRDFEELKEVYLEKSKSDPFIRQIQSFIHYPAENIMDALLLHLLATYIQLMPSPTAQNPEKIARFYMRTAWIYRLANPEVDKEQNIKKLETELQNFQSVYEQLQSGVLNTLNNVESMNEWYQDQVRGQKNVPGLPRWSDYNQQFRQLYEIMMKATDVLVQNMNQYQKIGSDYRERSLGADSSPFKMDSGDFQNFTEFVESLKVYWTDLPANEDVALEKAAESMKDVIKSGKYEEKKIKLFRFFELLISVLEKLEKDAEALSFALDLHEKLFVLQKQSKRTLERAEKHPDQEEKATTIQQYLTKLLQIQQSNTKRIAKIKQKIFEQEQKKAREIFHRNRSLSPADLKKVMVENNIPSALIKKFTEHLTQEKKKGIFQIFKL